MKIKFTYIFFILTIIGFSGHAQVLKKLKQTAEQAAEKALVKKTDEKVTEATENALDDLIPGNEASDKRDNSKSIVYANPSKNKNTEAKQAFYSHDIFVKTFDKEKQATVSTYFDADEIAMQSNWKDAKTGEAKTMYIDSEGFYIAYNEAEERFEKTSMLSSGVMAMMAPNMMISAYKLPAGPFWDTSKKLDDEGLKLNTFMYVEFAFIYKPGHFREDMYKEDYTESEVTCRGNPGCSKFSINDPGYYGSYILFDSSNRLAEINVKMKDDPNYGSGEGKLEFFYQDCEVKLPAATEVKQPGQDLLMKGLDIH
jgi:hypothetical protein